MDKKYLRKHIGITLLLLFLAAIFFTAGLLIAQNYDGFFWRVADNLFQSWAFSFRQSRLTTIMIMASNLGYYGVIIGWGLLFCVFLRKKSYPLMVASGVLATFTILINFGIKQIFERPRPVGSALVAETGFGFPSSHAFAAAVFFLMVAYTVFHFSRKYLVSFLVELISIAMILVISFSRVYLGVHNFSDVAAGMMWGTALVSFTLAMEKTYWLMFKHK